jgi:tRNA (mo5U34)-methyltransferase
MVRGVEAATAQPDLRERIAELDWYHTLEVAPGVETPGYYDHRPILDRMPIPPSLEGKRCLDIGTFDGFWAFEMERRGASEVVGIDILDPRQWDWPAGSTDAALAAIGKRKAQGQGFEIVRESLGSQVKRLELSVHDLDPADVGEFDFVYFGSLLLHLRDPIGALTSAHSVCAGEIVVCDAIDAFKSRVFRSEPVANLDGLGRPWWWLPNVAGLQRMVVAAGFEPLGEPVKLYLPPGPGHPPRQIRPRLLLSRIGRMELLRPWRGDPHAAIRARPAR